MSRASPGWTVDACHLGTNVSSRKQAAGVTNVAGFRWRSADLRKSSVRPYEGLALQPHVVVVSCSVTCQLRLHDRYQTRVSVAGRVNGGYPVSRSGGGSRAR